MKSKDSAESKNLLPNASFELDFGQGWPNNWTDMLNPLAIGVFAALDGNGQVFVVAGENVIQALSTDDRHIVSERVQLGSRSADNDRLPLAMSEGQHLLDCLFINRLKPAMLVARRNLGCHLRETLLRQQQFGFGDFVPIGQDFVGIAE